MEKVYTTLKFRNTEFRFKNSRKFNEYFDDKLRIGVEVYKSELKRYMEENLHVLFSFFWSMRALFFVNLFVTLLMATQTGKLVVLGLAGVSGIAALILYRITRNYAAQIECTTSLNEFVDEIYYEIRDEMLEEDKKKANTI